MGLGIADIEQLCKLATQYGIQSIGDGTFHVQFHKKAKVGAPRTVDAPPPVTEASLPKGIKQPTDEEFLYWSAGGAEEKVDAG